MTDRMEAAMPVEAPERIWIESEGGCPYFYHKEELSDVGCPVTEYVRADKLRAEVAEWKRVASAQAELRDEAEDCAEELAKALAELITWIPSADTYRRLGFDPAAPMRALERAKHALGSIGGLSND